MTIRSIRIRHRLRWLTSFVGAAAASVALAPSAHADSLLDAITPCSEPTTQAFAAWGDLGQYALTPGGDFEGDLAGWTLNGGAAQTDGSEPYGVTGAVGSHSLTIPEGGEAISAPTCIDPTRDSLRLFSRSDSGDARLKVEAIYLKRGVKIKTDKLDKFRTQADWQPSESLENPLEKILRSVVGGAATVSYRFTAVKGSVQIDDVFVDPRFNR